MRIGMKNRRERKATTGGAGLEGVEEYETDKIRWEEEVGPNGRGTEKRVTMISRRTQRAVSSRIPETV